MYVLKCHGCGGEETKKEMSHQDYAAFSKLHVFCLGIISFTHAPKVKHD